MLLGRLPFTLVQSNTGNPVFIGTPTVATTYETFLIIRKDQAGELSSQREFDGDQLTR
jgi:hypothetical protein